MSFAGRFTTVGRAREFILAGNATITLVSVMTQVRFTYRIRMKREEYQGRFRENPNLHFVSVLTGSNNENDYTFLSQRMRTIPIMVICQLTTPL